MTHIQTMMIVTVIIMIMEIDVCHNMMQSLMIGVLSGIVSSFLFWIVLNVCVPPHIHADDQIQYNNRKKYVRIYNKSCLSVYEVICYIEYKYNDGNRFFRTDKPLPYLEKKRGIYHVVLNRNSGKPIQDDIAPKSDQSGSKSIMPVEKFFSQPKGTITLTVTYQTRFGIKRTVAPIVYKIEPSNYDAQW